MTRPDDWKRAASAFFAERASAMGSDTTLEGLCYVSGRDPRIWTQPEIYADLIDSILGLCAAGPASRILEVGCASGFLAWGLAPRVGGYTGVDVAEPALRAARRLGLKNAEFRKADGVRLPFPDGSFDAALCYDVFTNFPAFADGEGIIREMIRVVRPGGPVLVGSIPDEDQRTQLEARAASLARDFDERYGPVRSPAGDRRPGLLERLRTRLGGAAPAITCYYFRRQDFLDLAAATGTRAIITDIHRLNPYSGMRFNVVYARPAP